MPKNNTKGGKKQKKIKKQGEQERDLQFKDQLQEYGQILRLLGDSRLEIQCIDGVKRMGHIRGKMRKKVWMTAGDIVLVALREYEKDKCDIILKYTQEEIMKLKQLKEIPDNLKVNESESENRNKDNDNLIEFEKNTNKEQESNSDEDDEMYMSDNEEEESEDEEEEKEEKKTVKKDNKNVVNNQPKIAAKLEEMKIQESESEEEPEEISNKIQANDDFMNDFCKDQKKTPSILGKTSHTVKSNQILNKNTGQNNYNKPTQNYSKNQGGKKKFVEIDLKKI